LASVTSAVPVSITFSTRFGSASPVRFCAFQCARSTYHVMRFDCGSHPHHGL
jgi:hypothetical protein